MQYVYLHRDTNAGTEMEPAYQNRRTCTRYVSDSSGLASHTLWPCRGVHSGRNPMSWSAYKVRVRIAELPRDIRYPPRRSKLWHSPLNRLQQGPWL